jgi:hypothetical protein
MYPHVSSDPLRLSSCDTFLRVSWWLVHFLSKCGGVGGVSVPRPLRSPHKSSGSFIIF